MRRIVLAVLACSALPLQAQIGRRVSAEPGYWVGLSYGYVDGVTLTDETTSSTWRFRYTSQIRATFEKTLQRGITVGAAAGFSNGRLTYTGGSVSGVCIASCSADADVSQYTAFVRGGNGLGFHGFYNLEAGVTRFSNFRERDSGDQLQPMSATNDLTFGFGGGFGYGFSPTMSAYAGEQIDLVLHPQADGADGSAPRLMTFRAGFRVGF